MNTNEGEGTISAISSVFNLLRNSLFWTNRQTNPLASSDVKPDDSPNVESDDNVAEASGTGEREGEAADEGESTTITAEGETDEASDETEEAEDAEQEDSAEDHAAEASSEDEEAESAEQEDTAEETTETEEEDLAQLKQKIEELQSSIESLQEERDASQAEVERLSAALQTEQTTIEQLQAELESVQTEMVHLRHASEADRAALMLALETAPHEDPKKAKGKEIASLRSQFTRAQEELETEIKKFKRDIANLNAQLAEKTAEVKKLQGLISEVSQTKKAQEAIIAALERKVKALEQALKKHTEAQETVVAELKDKIKTLEQALKEKTEALEQKLKAPSSLKEAVDARIAQKGIVIRAAGEGAGAGAAGAGATASSERAGCPTSEIGSRESAESAALKVVRLFEMSSLSPDQFCFHGSIVQALAEHGVAPRDIDVKVFATPGQILQLGALWQSRGYNVHFSHSSRYSVIKIRNAGETPVDITLISINHPSEALRARESLRWNSYLNVCGAYSIYNAESKTFCYCPHESESTKRLFFVNQWGQAMPVSALTQLFTSEPFKAEDLFFFFKKWQRFSSQGYDTTLLVHAITNTILDPRCEKIALEMYMRDNPHGGGRMGAELLQAFCMPGTPYDPMRSCSEVLQHYKDSLAQRAILLRTAYTNAMPFGGVAGAPPPAGSMTVSSRGY